MSHGLFDMSQGDALAYAIAERGWRFVLPASCLLTQQNQLNKNTKIF